MTHLIPCETCARHVLDSETCCPFCGQALAGERAAPILPGARLGRTALFAFGATLAAGLSLTGCGGAAEEDPADPGSDQAAGSGGSASGKADDKGKGGSAGGDFSGLGGFSALYGLPPPPELDAGIGGAAGAAGSAGAGGLEGTGGFSALYGSPPLPLDAGQADGATSDEDAGQNTGGSPTMDGGIAPLYGLPPN